MPVTAPNVSGFAGGYLSTEAFYQNMDEDKLDHQVKQLAYTQTVDKLEKEATMARQAAQMMDDLDAKEGKDSGKFAIDAVVGLSKLAVHNGMPVQGLEYLKAATTMIKDDSITRVRAENYAIRKGERVLKDVAALPPTKAAFQEYFTQLLITNGDADPQSQSVIQQQLYAVSDPKFDPVRFKQSMVDASMTSLHNAQQQREQANTRLTNARTAETTFRTEELLPVYAESSRRRTDAYVKHQGASTVQAKPADIKAASDVILETVVANTASEKAKVAVASRGVAERAGVLQDSQGLSPTNARTQALEEARSRGDLAGLRPAKAGPGSRTKPREVVDTNFIPGNWYIGAVGSAREGQLAFYNGQELLSDAEMKAAASQPLGEPPTYDEEPPVDDNEPLE